jgi:hypothetical protein
MRQNPYSSRPQYKSIADSFAHAEYMTPYSSANKEVFPYNRHGDFFERPYNGVQQTRQTITENDKDRVLSDLE